MSLLFISAWLAFIVYRPSIHSWKFHFSSSYYNRYQKVLDTIDNNLIDTIGKFFGKNAKLEYKNISNTQTIIPDVTQITSLAKEVYKSI